VCVDNSVDVDDCVDVLMCGCVVTVLIKTFPVEASVAALQDVIDFKSLFRFAGVILPRLDVVVEVDMVPGVVGGAVYTRHDP